jgi:hypothetical protein
LEALEDRTLLSTYLVDRLTDTGVGSGLAGDLRYAITQAVDGDAINFGVTGTINLTGALPNLTHNISINGPGANLLTVRRDTSGDYGIFAVNYPTAAAISGLTISNGQSLDAGGIENWGTLTLSNCALSQIFGGVGGGIFNVGSLSVSNCTVTQNRSYSDGAGGIYNWGFLTASNCTLSGNSRAIVNDGATAALNNCTITNNGGAFGGGVANEAGATMTIANCTISGNTSSLHGGGDLYESYGGGIYNGGSDLVVTNSTITGNVAGESSHDPVDIFNYGGGIANIGGPYPWNLSTLTINNCTISGNSAASGGTAIGTGGGIFGSGYSTLNMRNTMLAGNSATDGPDLDGALTSSGYNLIGNSGRGSGFDATDLLNVNPLLGPLQNNGGPTQTMALLAGSPALNAGDPDQLGVADQRGVVRSGGVNIGAYQASATAFVLTAPATATAGTPFDLTVTAVDPFGQTALGYTGTVTFSTTDPDPGVILPADYVFLAADQGKHTFPGGATLYTAGGQTLRVTDTLDSTLTGSVTVTL